MIWNDMLMILYDFIWRGKRKENIGKEKKGNEIKRELSVKKEMFYEQRNIETI